MKKILMAALVVAGALFTSCNNGTPKASLKTDVDTLSYEMGMVLSSEESDFASMLAQQGSDSAYVDEFIKGYIAGMKSADDKKQLAYNMGLQAGMQIKMQLPMMAQQVFQGDTTKTVSVKNFVAGFVDYAKSKTMLQSNGKPMDKMEANKHIMDYMFSKQKNASAQFMAEKAKEAGVKALSNGIYYKELAAGNAAEHCTMNDSVEVKYEGKLVSGNVFDSTERQPGGSATLNLKNVIKGWQVAISQMPVGATWEVYIPYDQAYGEQGSGPIPPYSALIFKITLVRVIK